MTNGVLDLGFYTGKLMPDGLSGDGIAAYQALAGWDYMDVAELASAAVAGFLQRKANQYGWGFAVTAERWKRYPNAGTSTRLNPTTTKSQPVYYTGEEIGHALPLINWEQAAIALTLTGSELLTMGQIESAIRNMVASWDKTFDYEFWWRKTSNVEQSHELGTSVPFVRGTGGTVDFVPPPVGAKTFTSAHDHFNASTNRETLVNSMVVDLLEHELPPGQVVLTISRADFSNWSALEDFAILIGGALQWDRGGATSGPQFAQMGTVDYAAAGVIGGFYTNYGLIAVRATDFLPTNYCTMEISYGNLNPMNSIHVCYDPRQTPGWGPNADMETARRVSYPFSAIVFPWKFGVGVNNRLNGVAGYSGGATWANPTLSI